MPRKPARLTPMSDDRLYEEWERAGRRAERTDDWDRVAEVELEAHRRGLAAEWGIEAEEPASESDEGEPWSAPRKPE